MKIKATIVLSLAALSAVATAQVSNNAKYTINGSCPKGVDKVFLIDIARRGAVVDSASVNSGVFSIEGYADSNAFLGIAVKGASNYVMFIVDDTPIEVDMAAMTIKGSPLNEKLNAYDRQVDTERAAMNQYVVQYNDARQSGMSEEELAALATELTKKYINPIEEKVVALEKEIIRANPDNIIPAVFIADVMYDCTVDELSSILSDENAYSSHPLAASAKRYLADLQKKMAVIGTQFKDLEMTGLDGKSHSLSEYCGQGNYVLIDFWASWCGPCRAEMPNVKANYDKYHSAGFDIVGVSFDNNESAWKKCVSDMELNWNHISDLKGWQSAAAAAYNIRSIPSSLLVDPSGKITDIDLRADKLGERLSKIYGF